MKKTILLISLLLVLTGCCATTTTKYDQVPVASCPTPPPMALPGLAVNMLPQEPKLEDALHAIRYDGVTCRGALKTCIQILDGYR